MGVFRRRYVPLVSLPARTDEVSFSVDAKSSFKGKSFEITPVGVAHVHLRIPKEWAPDLPPAPMFPGMVIEHYSWTKVTTSVSNFLFGNPIIDHFGEMVSLPHSPVAIDDSDDFVRKGHHESRLLDEMPSHVQAARLARIGSDRDQGKGRRCVRKRIMVDRWKMELPTRCSSIRDRLWRTRTGRFDPSLYDERRRNGRVHSTMEEFGQTRWIAIQSHPIRNHA